MRKGITLFPLLALALMLSVMLLLGGCRKKEEKKDSDMTGFEKSLTAKDTLAVTHLVDQFFGYAESGRITDAVAMLYMADTQNKYGEPQLLDNDKIREMTNLLKMLPIKSHHIDYMKFSNTYANEVKCTATIAEATGNRPAVTTVFYFKPIDYLTSWKLCVMDSNNGDKTVVKREKRDSVAKEYTRRQLEKSVRNAESNKANGGEAESGK